MTGERAGGIRGWWGDAKNNLLNKIVDGGISFFEHHGTAIYKKLKDKGITGNVGEKIMGAVLSGDLKVPMLERFLENEGPILRTLELFSNVSTASQSNEDDLNQYLLLLKQDDASITKLLDSPTTQAVITHLQAMGGGASREFMAGLGNKAYRDWYYNNVPEVILTGRLAERYQLVPNETEPDVFKCAYCGTTTESKTKPEMCPSCSRPNEMAGFKREETEEFRTQQRIMVEWEKVSEQKREELIPDGEVLSSQERAAQMGAGIATILAAGGGITGLFEQFGISTSPDEGALATVRNSHRGQQAASKTGPSETEAFRLPDRETAGLLTELQIAMNAGGDITIGVGQRQNEPIIANEITVGKGAIISAPIICNKITFTGQAVLRRGVIVFERAAGHVPTNGNFLYVTDPEFSVRGEGPPFPIGRKTTIDKAYQLAIDKGLLKQEK